MSVDLERSGNVIGMKNWRDDMWKESRSKLQYPVIVVHAAKRNSRCVSRASRGRTLSIPFTEERNKCFEIATRAIGIYHHSSVQTLDLVLLEKRLGDPWPRLSTSLLPIYTQCLGTRAPTVSSGQGWKTFALVL
jgi:hypothetical protein